MGYLWKKSARGERYPLQGAFSCSAGPCSLGFSRRSQRQGYGGSISSWVSTALPTSTQDLLIQARKRPWRLCQMVFGIQMSEIWDRELQLSVEIKWAGGKGVSLCTLWLLFLSPIPNYPGIFAYPSWAHHPSFTASGRAVGSTHRQDPGQTLSRENPSAQRNEQLWSLFPRANGSLREPSPWDGA